MKNDRALGWVLYMFWDLQELIFPQILLAEKYPELPLDLRNLLKLMTSVDSANWKVIVDYPSL